MTALDIACRVCDQQPGEDCKGAADGAVYHAERILDADTMTRVADPVSSDEFERAVLGTHRLF